MARKTPTVEEVRERMKQYRYPREFFDAWANVDDDIACKKCGRVIYCGDLNKMCGDPECELKQRSKE